ncbi:TfoX/Sxy family protein [Nocardia macrotermitis]|uniref:TfoX N-terminal domain-containing protein n=1 Tax=Nocardia macrotermitis TaxID=2585198 RepID=A0A7K0D2W9_9NOCA|nr:TfoX/Sxy family protein [Nocardia macrotermitis]MQY20059.1 hypothetical protein [Nocardia macrotermitis]
MAYDEELAERIRDLLGPVLPEVAEKKMFGGLAFLIGGNMAVAASGQGGMMVRVDPARAAAFLGAAGVAPMVMGGREMKNWLRVDTTVVHDDADLQQWVERGVEYARSLPPK